MSILERMRRRDGREETAPQEAAPARGRRRLIARGVGALIAAATVAILGKALLTPAAPPPAPGATPGPAAPLVGHIAPDVALHQLDGKPLTLGDLRGSVVVLNFWYVNCEPCRFEMPALQRVYDARKAHGLVMLGVDTVDDTATIRTFVGQLGVRYPIVQDEDLRTTLRYKVVDTPSTFVIDRHGVIRFKTVGPVERSDLEREVAALEAEQ